VDLQEIGLIVFVILLGIVAIIVLHKKRSRIGGQSRDRSLGNPDSSARAVRRNSQRRHPLVLSGGENSRKKKKEENKKKKKKTWGQDKKRRRR